MSKLDFSGEIQDLRGDAGWNTISETNAINILRACEESGLSVEEIVLLLKANVRARMTEQYNGCKSKWGVCEVVPAQILLNLIADLTPEARS